jgi:hypothetical protein
MIFFTFNTIYTFAIAMVNILTDFLLKKSSPLFNYPFIPRRSLTGYFLKPRV